MVFESADSPKWLDDWSRDGKFLLFRLPLPGRLFALPLAGDPSTPSTSSGKPILLAETPANFDSAHFSPDGKWVVYQSSESGQFEVWVATFPAFDNRRRVSPRGGGQAFWRGDGKELFYLSLDGKMMSVQVTPDPSRPGGLEFRAPTEMFQSPFPRPALALDQYAVTDDGQRFLLIQPRRDLGSTVAPVTVVVNWLTGLGKE
jgi:hypothetical protein